MYRLSVLTSLFAVAWQAQAVTSRRVKIRHNMHMQALVKCSVLYTAYICSHLSNVQCLAQHAQHRHSCWSVLYTACICCHLSKGQCLAQHKHSCCCRWFAERLVALRHADGAPLCVLYGAHHLQPRAQAPGAVGQGPVVTFNLLRHDGSFFGYRSAAVLCCAVLCCAVLNTGKTGLETALTCSSLVSFCMKVRSARWCTE